MDNLFLAGARAYLRPLEMRDASLVAGWLNDPEVRRFLLRQHPLSVAEEEAFIHGLGGKEGELVLGVCLQQGGRLVGVAGLHRIDFVSRHACFGIAIGEKAEWGKGLGTEVTGLLLAHAFQALNMNRVWLEVFDTNTSAIRVYQKLGFRVEGRLRQHVFRQGRYRDVLVMGLLRDEWPGQT